MQKGEAVFERKFQYSCHLKLLKNQRADLFRYAKGYGRLISENEVELKHVDKSAEIIRGEYIEEALSNKSTVKYSKRL